jgi:hypothetical protein
MLEGEMSKRIVIDLNRDLPERTRMLTADSLSKVFGGCPDRCYPAQPNICCDSYGCNKQWNNTYRCTTSAWI